MITREQAEKFREIITAHAEDFSDEEAVQAPHLFPGWNGGGTTYAVGDRIQYGGKPYKCLQEHTSQVTWTPEDAPSLWALILIPDPEVIPDWVQPDSTNAYTKGDKVRFEGKVYESLIDNNVWSPAAYPAGWKEVEEN